LIDDPNSAEFERISKSTKPLSPNRNHFSKKRTTIETQIASQNRGSSLLFETKGIDIYRVGRTSKEDRMKLRPLPRSADTAGLTAGHGIIVRLDCTKNLRLLAHEFVHVAQYERLGKVGFLQEYIQQIAAHGYPDAPFELEAEAKAVKACRDAGVRPF
jgi:hypothetical protein